MVDTTRSTSGPPRSRSRLVLGGARLLLFAVLRPSRVMAFHMVHSYMNNLHPPPRLRHSSASGQCCEAVPGGRRRHRLAA